MIHIEKPGMLTTIQDIGRQGFQQYGVIVSGAMDTLALQTANILVGNAQDEAVLEVTMGGLRFKTDDDCVVAMTGAAIQGTINGRDPLQSYRPVALKAGDTVQLGPLLSGCRNYIAFRGGIDVPAIMNSKSTYLRAGIGGYKGRALKKGDALTVYKHTAQQVKWQAEPPHYAKKNWTVHVTAGPEWAQFTAESQHQFLTTRYDITAAADRMGYRLKGTPLQRVSAEELLSDAVLFGTIQVSNDAQPTVLLADRQTTGGYPRIAQVIASDLHVFAQMKPGDSIQFECVTLTESYALLTEQTQYLRKLAQAVRLQQL